MSAFFENNHIICAVIGKKSLTLQSLDGNLFRHRGAYPCRVPEYDARELRCKFGTVPAAVILMSSPEAKGQGNDATVYRDGKAPSSGESQNTCRGSLVK